MKTIITVLFAVMLASCKKDETCNCGQITADGITNGCYWLEIRNDCSGNKKQFCFDEATWTNNHVGEYFCVTNEDNW